MIVSSLGQLQALSDPPARWTTSGGGSLNLYGASPHTYAAIYRSQPNVRTVVDFIARNVAQLGLHVFRRVSETDRQRLPDHDLALWLERPNPWTTRYRLIETLMQDLGIYANAYLLKVRSTPFGLVRLPPSQMIVVGALQPVEFVWTVNGREKTFDPSQIVYFNRSVGHSDDAPQMGVSPLETLRRILAEEAAAGAYRQSMWTNSARQESVIQLTKDGPKYTEAQLNAFRDKWQEFSAGGFRAGQTPIMPPGMELKPASWSSKDSEYLAARKLTREECAAAYHVPLPFVGILDHATFSNIREQHKHLYQDCLGPDLEMIQGEFERQLLVESNDQRAVYLEFNIAEKLKGSFEEQAGSLQTLVGAPVMTRNEGRARLNLPQVDDPTADELILPLNMGGGARGPATLTDAPTDPANTAPPADDTGNAVNLAPVIQATRERQQARLGKLPVTDRPAHFAADLDRWNRELAADLSKLTGADETALAAATNTDTLARLEADATDARLAALEQKPKPAIRRTFERDQKTGLVTAFTDAVVEER